MKVFLQDLVKTLRNRNYLGFPDARADTASGGVKLVLTGAPLNSEQEVASDEMAKPFQGINSQCLGTQWATDLQEEQVSTPNLRQSLVEWRGAKERPDSVCSRRRAPSARPRSGQPRQVGWVDRPSR